MTAERVVEEMRRVALADIRDLFNEAGQLRKPSEWSAEAAAAVASFDIVTKANGSGDVEYVARIRTWDKTKTLEMLGKHLGLLKETVEVTGKDGAPLGGLSDDELKARVLVLVGKL